MEYFLQQLINGITLGSIYGLIAIGYTMVYGIIGMINFAHGEIFMIGSFVSLTVFLALAALGITFLPLVLLIWHSHNSMRDSPSAAAEAAGTYTA